MRTTPSRLPLFAVGVLAAGLDLFTKWWVFATIPDGEWRPVFGDSFGWRPTRNPAGPWSWGHGMEFLRFGLPLVSVAAIAVIGRIWWRTDARDRVKGLGLVLILGGALGNFWDRILAALDPIHVGVRDFILVRGIWFGGDFPAFNLADTWITVGVVLVAWRILFEARLPGESPAAVPEGAAPAPPEGAPAESREAGA